MSQVRVPADSGYVGTPEEIAYEARAAENSIFTGGRLMIGIEAFAFASLAFAYFYLRSTNSEQLWRPHDVTAPTGIGTAIMACAVSAFVLSWYGLRRFREGAKVDWEVSWWVAVIAGLFALGLQCWELTDLSFSPGSSGYSSVFIGWVCLYFVLLVSGIYWSETLLARYARLRSGVREEGGARSLPTPPSMRVSIDSCMVMWGFIALVSVFFWIFFYVAV